VELRVTSAARAAARSEGRHLLHKQSGATPVGSSSDKYSSRNGISTHPSRLYIYIIMDHTMRMLAMLAHSSHGPMAALQVIISGTMVWRRMIRKGCQACWRYCVKGARCQAARRGAAATGALPCISIRASLTLPCGSCWLTRGSTEAEQLAQHAVTLVLPSSAPLLLSSIDRWRSERRRTFGATSEVDGQIAHLTGSAPAHLILAEMPSGAN